MSETATRSIADLPDLEILFGATGTEMVAPDFAQLFALPEPMARSGPRRLIVFRNADLRAIAAHPASGNMPASEIINRAYLDRSATSLVTDTERAHLARLYANWMFTTNPPVHGPTRQVFARPLMPKFMQPFADIANRIVPQLIDAVVGRGEIDFGLQFTEQLTARLWGDVFGMTAEESGRIVHTMRAMGPLFFLQRTPDEVRQTNAALGDYLDIISTAVHRTLAAGSNAMLNEMAAEFDAIDLDGKPENLGLSIAANLIDGFHTASLAAVNAVYLLLLNPKALAAVRDNPALVPNALAEGLRMLPPVIVTHRHTLETFDYQGLEIPEGTAIAMLWAAGSRDPAVFEDPNSYNLMRQQRPNATFGGGIHICPGRNVARVIVEAVLRGLTAPGISVELTGPVEWVPRSTMRQPTQLPLAITRAATQV